MTTYSEPSAYRTPRQLISRLLPALALVAVWAIGCADVEAGMILADESTCSRSAGAACAATVAEQHDLDSTSDRNIVEEASSPASGAGTAGNSSGVAAGSMPALGTDCNALPERESVSRLSAEASLPIPTNPVFGRLRPPRS